MLIDILKDRGMPQKVFAERLGVTRGAINHVIKGRRPFPVRRLVPACEILDCKIGDLRPDLVLSPPENTKFRRIDK